jgi:hypothetical protein
MDWEQEQAFRRASEAAGADVRRQRQDRADHGARTAHEVRDLRERAAQSATVCGDCFQPLAPNASVTMQGRPVLVRPGIERRLRVPICLRCWLVSMTPSHRKSEGIARFRCEACHRPMRVWRPPWWTGGLHRTQRVCCDDCRRSLFNARARERRRVRHEPMHCAVCERPFTPKRNDAVTCSNTCRQSLHRQRHSSQPAKKR